MNILPAPAGAPGCVVRLIAPDEDSRYAESLTYRWVQGWSESNPDGISVNPTDIAVMDAVLVRGPWCVGDRFTIAGFAAAVIWPLGYAQILGFQHVDVTTVNPDRVELTFDFWFGIKGPETRGRGHAAFVKDRDGIVLVQAHWVRTDAQEVREVDLKITRTGVTPATAGFQSPRSK